MNFESRLGVVVSFDCSLAVTVTYDETCLWWHDDGSLVESIVEKTGCNDQVSRSISAVCRSSYEWMEPGGTVTDLRPIEMRGPEG